MDKGSIIAHLLKSNNNSWKETISKLLDIIFSNEKELKKLEAETTELKKKVISLEWKLLSTELPKKRWLNSMIDEFGLPDPPDTDVVGITPAPQTNAEMQTAAAQEQIVNDLKTEDIARTIGVEPLDTSIGGSPF